MCIKVYLVNCKVGSISKIIEFIVVVLFVVLLLTVYASFLVGRGVNSR